MTATVIDGYAITVLPAGHLQIEIDEDTVLELTDLRDRRGYDDVTTLMHLLEPEWTNGRYEPFDAGAANPFVGLTSAPCIAESMGYDEDADKSVVGKLWWFPNYMVRSPIDDLIENRKVVFTFAFTVEPVATVTSNEKETET